MVNEFHAAKGQAEIMEMMSC